MVRRCSAYIFFLAVISTTGALSAQAPDHLHRVLERRVYEGPPLSLQQAIDEALGHNPALVALRKQFDATRQRPAQQRALMPPSLDAQIWQWPVDTINPLNTNMYMFTMRQDLPGRGKRELRAALAESEVALSTAEIATRARTVITEVTRAYSEIAVARKATDVHLESVALLRQIADVSTIEYAAGRRPQQDVLKTVLELSKLHEDLVMHEEGAAVATARLNALLDREPQAPLGPVAEPREQIDLPASDTLQQLALERQPEIHTAHAEIDRARAALAVANSEAKPDFFVGGGYMLMPREAGAWTASIGMTWPNAPWSRARVESGRTEAAMALDAASARLHAIEREIQTAVHQAYVRAVAASQRVALLRSSVVPQSRQAADVSRIAYQASRVDFMSLIDTQRSLLDAELSYYRALNDREVALADLSRAVGMEIPSAMPEGK